MPILVMCMPKLKLLSIAWIGLLMSVIWHLFQSLDATKYQLEIAEQQRDGYAHAVGQLSKLALANAEDAAQLTDQLQSLQQHSRHRDQQWETLKREHRELKDWAERRLPADVSRLHQRPAITGAAEYQRWLQQSNSLHPAGEPAANQ